MDMLNKFHEIIMTHSVPWKKVKSQSNNKRKWIKRDTIESGNKVKHLHWLKKRCSDKKVETSYKDLFRRNPIEKINLYGI